MIEVKNRDEAIKAIIRLTADKVSMNQKVIIGLNAGVRNKILRIFMDEIKNLSAEEIKNVLITMNKATKELLNLYKMSDDELEKELDEALNPFCEG